MSNKILFDSSLEPILNENEKYDTYIFPLKHSKAIDYFYESLLRDHWDKNAIHFSKEDDFLLNLEDELPKKYPYNDKLTMVKKAKEIKEYVKKILAFFASADNVITDIVQADIMPQIKDSEIKCVLTKQAADEITHAWAYQTLLTKYVNDINEYESLNSSLKNNIETRHVIMSFKEWLGSDITFPEKLVIEACFEGVFFLGFFIMISWLKEENIKAPTLFEINDYIKRDESKHCAFFCYIYSLLNQKLSEERVKEIIDKIIMLASNYIRVYLMPNGKIEGILSNISTSDMENYMKKRANIIYKLLGYDGEIYEVDETLTFMDRVGLVSKDDFFTVNSANYVRSKKVKSLKIVNDF